MNVYKIGTVDNEDGLFFSDNSYKTRTDAEEARKLRGDNWFIFHESDLMYLENNHGRAVYKIKKDK